MEQAAAKNQAWGNRTLLALFLVCLFIAYELVRPFLSPLVLAAFLVAACDGPYRLLCARLGERRRLAASLATVAVVLVLVMPAALLVSMLVVELASGLDRLEAWLGPDGMRHVVGGQLPPHLRQALAPLERYVPLGQKELAGYIADAASWISAMAPGFIAVSAELLVQLLVLVLAIYYLFSDGRQLARWVTEISPLKSGYTRELLQEFYRVAYAMMVGTAAVAFLQGLAAALIFWALGIPSPLVWALALAFASFVPGIGVGLVYIPVAGYLFLTGHPNKAVVELVYSLGVIVLFIDNLVRPLMVQGRLTMHPLVIFVSIFGGVYLFGLVGLLLGPLVAAILIAVVRIYARDLAFRSAPPAPPTARTA